MNPVFYLFFGTLKGFFEFFLEGRFGTNLAFYEALTFLGFHISDCADRKGFLLQTLFHVLLDQYINNGEAGHTDEHADEAEKSRHDRDGYDDPYGGKTRGSTVNTGHDDIYLYVLYILSGNL